MREEQQKRVLELLKNPVDGQIETAAKILGARLMNNKTVESLLLTSQSSEERLDDDSGESYECMEEEFSMWDESVTGTINGGSDDDED